MRSATFHSCQCPTKRVTKFASALLSLVLATISCLGTGGCIDSPPPVGSPSPADGEAMARMMRKGAVEPVGPPMHATLRFTDLTAACGVDFSYLNGERAKASALPETLGGGVALVDWDGDGWLDIAFARGLSDSASDRHRATTDDNRSTGTNNRSPANENSETVDHNRASGPLAVFRNRGEMGFERAESAMFGIAATARVRHGVFAADYDGDGFPDYLVTGWGGPAQLLRNQGDGTFTDITELMPWAGDSDRWTTAAAWSDFNQDGVLDLFLARFVRWSGPAKSGDYPDPATLPADDSSLYLGVGDGRLEDQSRDWGLAKGGRTLGAVAADLDGDGDVDLYTGNFGTANYLYFNEANSRFTEKGESSAAGMDRTGNPGRSTGVDAGDWDGDGYIDLMAANGDDAPLALYRSVSPDLFFNSGERLGVGPASLLRSGWGAISADFDCDQDLDLAIATGHRLKWPAKSSRAQLPQLLENRRGGRFEDAVTLAAPFFQEKMQGRALAVGDLDNDGDLDIVFTRINQSAAILRNDQPRPKAAIQVRLVGVHGTRWPSGVRLRASSADHDQDLLWRSGHGYLSTHDPRFHIGIGPNGKLDKLEIHWPRRPAVTLKDVRAGAKLVVSDQ